MEKKIDKDDEGNNRKYAEPFVNRKNGIPKKIPNGKKDSGEDHLPENIQRDEFLQGNTDHAGSHEDG